MSSASTLSAAAVSGNAAAKPHGPEARVASSGPALRLTPIALAEANAFVEQHHRHRGAVVGAKFCIGLAAGDAIVGVLIAGRPVARGLDNGLTLEVNRCCTDGTRHACSMLYSAAWRAARALGYERVVTYTLKSEPGSSLLGAGWRVVGEVKGRSWSCQSRPRVDTSPLQDKLRWEMAA